MDDPSAAVVGVVDLVAVTEASAAVRPAWSHQSSDLSVNLVVLDAGDGIEEHVNREVDVLLVGVLGAGVVTIDEERHPLGPGTAVVVPKGARRGTQAGNGRFAYLTCHRRRAGLWPVPRG